MKDSKKTKTKTTKPTTWQIFIGFDPTTGKITYRDASNNDASRIFPINGDTIQWALARSIKNQPFQVDFGLVNPFHVGSPVSYRGTKPVLSEAVNFPEEFLGSKLCKYNLSLGNGWSDDPDVVPVPADTVLHPNQIRLGAECLISWHINNGAIAGITLNPPDLTSLSHQAVDWRWADGQPADTADFSLTFASAVPDCPLTSESSARELVLTPGKVAQTKFTIDVMDSAGSPWSNTGSLTVT